MTNEKESINWRIPQWFKGLNAEQQKHLKSYNTELIRFNKQINLISGTTEINSDSIHFADCIMSINLMLKENVGQRVFDLGSGNGLPGIVLAILDSRRTIVLVEKDTRKVEFLRYIGKSLNLDNLNVIQGQIENLGGQNIEFAISRALASVTKSLLMTRKIFKKDGLYFQMKSSGWVTEVSDIPPQIYSHWSSEFVGTYTLPGTNIERVLLKCKKLTD
ncbi:MAG: 16S rRNA (guanine(527)-N(7))-methyltransferase RsmG [Bdellovibrionales bacterium]|nr:16S rRNA (guanine(527)-N(7))-methyltransferase RsmG [Bdellovibrionales bacterium]